LLLYFNNELIENAVPVSPDDVSNRNLTYGVTLDRSIALKYGAGSNWFSACDFIVERIGD
jgi:hypothetical protein